MPEHDVFLADCPARSALELITGTWTVVALVGLSHGPRRYSELLGRIGGISRKMLTQTLRAGVRTGLVEPPSRRGGGYRLTELGESLMGPLTALTEWAEQHADDLAAFPLDAGSASTATSGAAPLGTSGFLRAP